MFEQVDCTFDNPLNLRDLVLQELVKIIVVCYTLEIRMCKFYTVSIKIYKIKLRGGYRGYPVVGIYLLKYGRMSHLKNVNEYLSLSSRGRAFSFADIFSLTNGLLIV
jgi:hypothetical protein